MWILNPSSHLKIKLNHINLLICSLTSTQITSGTMDGPGAAPGSPGKCCCSVRSSSAAAYLVFVFEVFVFEVFLFEVFVFVIEVSWEMLFIWLLKWCCCSATADVSFGAAAVEHHRPALGSPLQTSHYSCTSCYLQCTKFSNIGFWKAPPLLNEKLPFFIQCIMITGLPKAFDQLCISETAPVLAWISDYS